MHNLPDSVAHDHGANGKNDDKREARRATRSDPQSGQRRPEQQQGSNRAVETHQLSVIRNEARHVGRADPWRLVAQFNPAGGSVGLSRRWGRRRLPARIAFWE